LLIVSGVAALTLVAAIPIAWHLKAEVGMTNRHSVRAALAVAVTMLTGANSAAALAVPPTTIGVSLSEPAYYRKARSLANLAAGGIWYASDRHKPGLDEIDKDGNIKRIAPGITLTRVMTPPNAPIGTAAVRCTWKGKGDFQVLGAKAQNVHYAPGSATFTVQNGELVQAHTAVQLRVAAVDASDPLRDLDCRETNMPATARFDPLYLETLQGFKVIRFMDWQESNRNAPVTWASRHVPGAIDTTGGDGVPIEDMIALAKESGADPWFNMPWNADDDYYERFARMVHDTLPADRTVYVEMGNEIWNQAFKASQQAMKEGMAANLAPDPRTAGLIRYAQRLAHVMDIWAKVYSDRPARLVRVATCQNGDACAKIVMGYQDTPRHVDALATAPYFGGKLMWKPFASSDELFAQVDGEIERVFSMALQAKAVAAHYGKRYLAYEAGQHLNFKDLDFLKKVEQDPRMYDAYKKYLDLWRTRIGDTIVLYGSSSAISRYGAWGLTEYVGQPIAEAPKMRAVREAMALTRKARTTH